MSDQSFPKSHRLLKPEDFRRVFDRRRSVTNGRLTICGCESELPHPRIGLSVSRRVGSAVARNRWKRMLREAFRLSRNRLPAGLDLVIVAKDQTPPELEWLLEEIPRLVGELRRKMTSRRRKGGD